MTAREHRCCNCLRRYCYHPSGDPRPENDARYCPTCKTAIMDALRAIPQVCRSVGVPVADPAEAEAVVRTRDAAKAKIAALRAAGEIVPERIWPPLIDMDETGKYIATQHYNIVRHDEQDYIVREWSDKREPPTVEKPMEKNLTTGEIAPW